MGLLDMKRVLSLLIQCSDTTIAGHLTSIAAELHMYADLKACMIAKYGKHKRQVIWEISEVVQDESEITATFSIVWKCLSCR